MADSKMDIFPDTSGEGRWLTYDEISQIRGIGRESAVKLAQREKWPRRPGNDRTARVFVPPDWLKPARTRQQESSPEVFPEWSRIVSVLEDAVTGLRERAEAADARADAAERRAEIERERADRLEQLRIAERTRADRAEAERTAEQEARAKVEAEAAILRQAEEGRRTLGRMARLRAAWRGR